MPKNPDCPTCHGKGTYMYDDNHSTYCPLCCDHPKGRRYVQSDGQYRRPGRGRSTPGMLTCGMCGKELKVLKAKEQAEGE